MPVAGPLGFCNQCDRFCTYFYLHGKGVLPAFAEKQAEVCVSVVTVAAVAEGADTVGVAQAEAVVGSVVAVAAGRGDQVKPRGGSGRPTVVTPLKLSAIHPLFLGADCDIFK